MRHTSRVGATVPMLLSGRYMHHIADLQTPRRLALRANKTITQRHGQDLASLMVMPVRSGTRREADVVTHAVFCVDCDRSASSICNQCEGDGQIGSICTVPVNVSVGCRDAVSGLCEARMSCMSIDLDGWLRVRSQLIQNLRQLAMQWKGKQTT